MKIPQSLLLTFLLTFGVTPLALGQAPFEPFEVTAELAVPPEPVTPATLSLQVIFAPGPPSDGINPASEAVTVEFQPPQPVQPPDPLHPELTAWHLLLPPGCFMERPNGQFRVEDSVGCGTSLQLFLDIGTSTDVSEGIVSLDASFKPPSGTKSEWRFRLDVELVEVPPQPVVPPEPIRGSTLLIVGDDIGEAVHSLVRWEGQPPEPVSLCPCAFSSMPKTTVAWSDTATFNSLPNFPNVVACQLTSPKISPGHLEAVVGGPGQVPILPQCFISEFGGITQSDDDLSEAELNACADDLEEYAAELNAEVNGVTVLGNPTYECPSFPFPLP